MHPLIFLPVFKVTIWGTETWALSGIKGSETVLYSGTRLQREIRQAVSDDSFDDIIREVEAEVAKVEASGQNAKVEQLTLPQMVEKYKEKLVGEKVWKRFGCEFPLLVKFINAKDDLSVQVHPSDEVAKKHGLARGKSEMWYILDAESRTNVYLGFKKDTSKEEFLKAVREASVSPDGIGRDSNWTSLGAGVKENLWSESGKSVIAKMLNSYNAEKGNWFYIPAGMIHSIGAGSYIAEIQQASTSTYRIFDYNRVDKSGKRRTLDLDAAVDALDFKASPYGVGCGSISTPASCKFAGEQSSVIICKMVECEYFTASMIKFDGSIKDKYHFDYSLYDSFVVLLCSNGIGRIFFEDDGKTDSVIINKGDVFLLPASMKCVDIQNSIDLRIIEAHL